MASLTGKLREGSKRITAPREAILKVLRSHHHPLTIKEVHTGLPEGYCDLATVYRAMHILSRLSMVKRFDFGDGVARFELLPEGDDGHHHHLVCIHCARIVEITECFSSDWELTLAQRHGFTAITHKLEFFGVCPGCQPECEREKNP